MTVHDLSHEQLIELKQTLLCRDDSPSYGDLADADELVSDETVFKEFDGVEFSNDDFFCTAGQ